LLYWGRKVVSFITTTTAAGTLQSASLIKITPGTYHPTIVIPHGAETQRERLRCLFRNDVDGLQNVYRQIYSHPTHHHHPLTTRSPSHPLTRSLAHSLTRGTPSLFLSSSLINRSISRSLLRLPAAHCCSATSCLRPTANLASPDWSYLHPKGNNINAGFFLTPHTHLFYYTHYCLHYLFTTYYTTYFYPPLPIYNLPFLYHNSGFELKDRQEGQTYNRTCAYHHDYAGPSRVSSSWPPQS
jgi:hypothetical protein